MVKPAEEQGFVGLRIEIEDTFTGGIFVGHGHMVLGLGADEIEPLLSAVRKSARRDRGAAQWRPVAQGRRACCPPSRASFTR